MKSKIVRTKSKLARAATWFFVLLTVVNMAGYFLQGTGYNEKLAYVSVSLGVITLGFYIASKYFADASESHK